MKKTHFLRPLLILTISLLAVLFMAYGISRGENIVIFEKAIRVCLECIGIG